MKIKFKKSQDEEEVIQENNDGIYHVYIYVYI